MTAKATPKQIKIIHCLASALSMSREDYLATLAGYGVESSKDLSRIDAARLEHDLEIKAVAAGKWKPGRAPRRSGKKPANMEQKKGMSYGRMSRAQKLSKIGALLTVGKRPWSYADALAKKICRTDDDQPIERVAWVPDDQLYKIITALRKQGIREGWDLSGE